MKKNVFGRKLKRDTNERKALFKSLLSSLTLHHRIRTTEAKAKAIKGEADKIVTLAKRGSQRLLTSYLTEEAIRKFTSEIAPRFTQRQGGYTRIIRLERRLSDNAQMVLMEWVEESSPARNASLPASQAERGGQGASVAGGKIKNGKGDEEKEGVPEKKKARAVKKQRTTAPTTRKFQRTKKEKVK